MRWAIVWTGKQESGAALQSQKFAHKLSWNAWSWECQQDTQLSQWQHTKKCVDTKKIHVFVDESSHSSWVELLGKPGGLQEHDLGKLIRYHSEVDIGTFRKYSECETVWEFIFLMDEISIISWSSDQVDTSKSTCLLRFSSVCGTDEWKQRSNQKMGKSENSKMHPSYKELLGIDGEAIEFGWNIFPRFSSLQIHPRDPTRFEKKEHQNWRVHGPDHPCHCFNDID